MSKTHNLKGQTFGKWHILQEVREKHSWVCKCECGSKKIVTESNLLRGLSRSCGCRRFESKNVTHARSKTTEYRIWAAMKRRCYNPREKSYHNYGGRGITVSKDWHSFSNFFRDMGKRPSPELTIERNDTNGNYEKGNCRWATMHEQMRNRRDTYKLCFNGKSMIVPDWAKETGIPICTIRNRIRLGWTIAEALTTPSILGRNSR